MFRMWERLVAFVTIWVAASCGGPEAFAQAPATDDSVLVGKTWVGEQPGVSLADGSKLLVIHLITFYADGTYKTQIKTAQKDQPDLGSSPIAHGHWFEGPTPDGKTVLCVQYGAGTWCGQNAIDTDNGNLEWGTETFVPMSDEAVAKVAPEFLGLPPLPYAADPDSTAAPPHRAAVSGEDRVS